MTNERGSDIQKFHLRPGGDQPVPGKGGLRAGGVLSPVPNPSLWVGWRSFSWRGLDEETLNRSRRIERWSNSFPSTPKWASQIAKPSVARDMAVGHSTGEHAQPCLTTGGERVGGQTPVKPVNGFGPGLVTNSETPL